MLLPYHADPVGLETVSRFKYTKDPNFPIRDCDDKTVPILSKAILDKIPCRAVVWKRKPSPSHISRNPVKRTLDPSGRNVSGKISVWTKTLRRNVSTRILSL